jgi:predicted O-linked N-acetylglucosamine transferase (SPINDLY family)
MPHEIAMEEKHPNCTEVTELFARGFTLHQQGRLAEASSIYQEIISLDPSNFDATHMSGVIALQTGNYPAAFELLKSSIELQPEHDGAHINLALVLQAYGRTDLALQCLNRAVTLNPSNPTAWNNRGNLLQDMGHLNEALDCYDKAVESLPAYTDAHNNRGNLLLKLQRHQEAIASFKSAIALDPGLAPAHYGLGLSLQEEKKLDQARECFDRTLTLDPHHADAHYHIGLLHHERRDFQKALDSYNKAIAINPEIDYLLGYRIYAKSSLCDWNDREEEIGRLVESIRSGKKAAPPFFYLALLDSPEIHLKAAQVIASGLPIQPGSTKSLSQDDNRTSREQPTSLHPDRRIRIGYLSGDFCMHAVGMLIVELLELHDREKFEVYGFCWSKEDGSNLRRRIVKAFDHHIPIGHLDDKEAAKLIESFDIDVLVDLQGMTSGARPNILLQKPAGAIQISYLGMPATSGLPSIDYIVADRHVLPAGLEPYMSEKPLHVPHCFQVSDRHRDVGPPLTRTSCGLPEGPFIFAAFNNNYKITPEIFSCWMQILKEAPNSVLWLTIDNEHVKGNLTRQAIRQSVDPERLIFSTRAQPAEYMARLALPDLFLDTFPYNAGTTANDILWMGTPILSYSGESYVSRMCGSLLNAAGLPELVAYSLAEYRDKAVHLSRNPELISTYKRRLARRDSYLFDIPALVRELESSIINICT